ncbi:TetR/AcrR family transcriptional regulator [Microterricola viridarii]|uniref:Regulatory protein, tetR family n=1 Tax=Microterricola viridarii TaxID=412690 RepID=A0A1H1UPS7_9MICO|nr:helix-turn-helix domain-containing protein [Microterricola viridarii]SDS74216.1 regulatory protein, tetR family [Microterricola viridarii]
MAAQNTTRAKLSQDSIVDALLALAREAPRAEVTFRMLGAELGVAATAIYRHFRDKDELYRAAVDRLYAEALSRVDRAEPSWRLRLAQYSDALAATYLEAPAIGQLAPLVDGRGSGELASLDFIFEALEQAGLSGQRLIDAYGAYAGHTLAFAAGMALELSRESTPGSSVPWIRMLDAGSLAQFPRLVRLRGDLLEMDTLGVYRAGVQAILDSIEAG